MKIYTADIHYLPDRFRCRKAKENINRIEQLIKNKESS